MRDRAIAGGVTALVAALTLLGPAAAEAASPFSYRGVVQGFYGTPYTHEERMRLLRFIGDYGLNTYVHAPKDELHHRTYWRQPYSAAEVIWFSEELAYADARGITFVPSLSPGIPRRPSQPVEGNPPDASVCFSCESEISALIEKFGPLWENGVRTFMLSFDDVERELPHAQDQQAFGTGDGAYGRANAHLLNAFLAALRTLDASARVVTVGADYTGTSDSAYLKAMRNNLSPEIDVMWTGERLRSRPLTPSHAREWTKVAGRQPIVWENWTNQDFVPRRLFMGPWHRDIRLVGEVKGFLLNPSQVLEANFLPLGTAARWFAAPGKYRPRRAFLGMARRLGGQRSELLRAFAETNYSTTLDPRSEAPTFVRLSDRLLRLAGRPAAGPTAGALLRELRLVRRAARLGRSSGLRPLVVGARPFFGSASRRARAGQLATRLLLASSRERETPRSGPARRSPRIRALRSRLIRFRRRLRSDPSFTYGNLTPWSNLRFGNVMDRYLDRVLARTAPPRGRA